MNFFKEIQRPVNEGPLDDVRARMDARRDPPEKQSANPNTPLPPVPPYVAPTKAAELKAGDIIGYRPKNAKMVPTKAKVLKLLSGNRAMVSVSSPRLIAQNNGSPVITIGPLDSLDIQNPYKEPSTRPAAIDNGNMIMKEAAEDWLPAYNALIKNNGAPVGGGSINNLNWKKSMALSAKDNGITGGQELANFVLQYAQNSQTFKTSNAGREEWNQLTNEIASLMRLAPTMDEMRAVVKQQDADKHQQNLTAIQQQLDLENAPLQHELSVQALINKAELDQADQKALLELDMEARLAIVKIKQDLELDAKERLVAIEREIEDRKEREDVRKHELEMAQAGYKHELAVINATAEGEYKKAKLEADYQIQIKQLDNIDNAGERQNRLDQINTEKAKQIAVIDAETKARVEVMQKEVDVEKQQSDIKIEQAFMMTLNPIWGAALTAAHVAGSTWKAGINNLNKALSMLSKPIMPKPQKEAIDYTNLPGAFRPTSGAGSPFKAMPMPMSLEDWKKEILAKYPAATFATERRPNGSTLAGEFAGGHGPGGLGIYAPSTGEVRIGPKGPPGEPLRIRPKGSVGEASRPDAYQRDEINATSGFGKDSQAYRADGGANDEDHEGDAWREKQEKSGTWYIRLNGKLIKDKAGKPYSFHGKAAANKAALTMQAKLFNQGKEFMLTTNPNDKPQGVAEAGYIGGHNRDEPDYSGIGQVPPRIIIRKGSRSMAIPPKLLDQYKADGWEEIKPGVSESEEHSPVASAITRRIMLQRHDLLSKYGPVLVTQAIDEVADFVGDVEEIGSSDVSGWIKQVEQMLANNPAEAFGESLKEDLQADDGDHYESADDFFGQFEAESFDNEETSPDGMEVRGYIDGVNVMVWRYDDESMTSGYGYYDDSAMQEGVAEASLAQMRDYFNKPDDSTSVTRAPATAGKNPAGVPQEIQNLINKMYHSGKVTPEEFKILQDFQRKTKINVGIKEASTGNAGYDSMLTVMKAVDAGQDATFDLGGEPITLDYNEARFLAGRYKAFLKAGRQEEFLKYMENPMSFDHLMKQLRDLIDKQKNFKGSVQGERGIEEGSQRVDSLVTKGLGLMRGPTRDDAVAAIKYQVGERDFNERRGFYSFYVRQLIDMYKEQGMSESMKSLPPVNENEYWCKIDSVAKPIPEGYKRTANGYITRA